MNIPTHYATVAKVQLPSPKALYLFTIDYIQLLKVYFTYPLTPIMHIVFCPPLRPNPHSLFFFLNDRRSLYSPLFQEIETLATLRLQSANEDSRGDEW